MAVQTLTLYVDNQEDDVGDQFTVSGSVLAVGTLGLSMVGGVTTTTKYYGGWRFRDVTIPKGATIISATLILHHAGVNGSNTNNFVIGYAVDNAPAWSFPTIRLANTTPETGASTPMGVSTVSPHRLDVTNIVAEITSRNGWVNGNAISFMGRPTSAVTGNVTYVQRDATGRDFAPRLVIQFEDGLTNAKISQLPLVNSVNGQDTMLMMRDGLTYESPVSALSDPLVLSGEFTSTSPSPPANGIVLYDSHKTNAPRPAWNGPNNIPTALQAALFSKNIAYWSATGNSAAAYYVAQPGYGAINLIATTTLPVARSVATTNLFTSTRRMGFQTAVATSSIASLALGPAQYCRQNGFEFIVRFGISLYSTNTTLMVGMNQFTNALGNSTVTNAVNQISISRGAGQANFSINHCQSNPPTQIDLGPDFPATTQNSDLYEFRLFAPPPAVAPNFAVTTVVDEVYYYVENLRTGATASGTLKTNLPSPGQMLLPLAWVNNGGVASASGIDIVSIYLEAFT